MFSLLKIIIKGKSPDSPHSTSFSPSLQPHSFGDILGNSLINFLRSSPRTQSLVPGGPLLGKGELPSLLFPLCLLIDFHQCKSFQHLFTGSLKKLKRYSDRLNSTAQARNTFSSTISCP